MGRIGEGRLAGKVALVTGAAQGIGAAIAQRFWEEGANVVVTDLALNLAAVFLDDREDRVLPVELDVRSAEGWRRAVAAAVQAFGRGPDVLVHNAGVMVPGTVEGPDLTAVAHAWEVNFLGPVLGTAACVPAMKNAGGGAVVVLSSIAATTGAAGYMPYAVSKAASIRYVNLAAHELGEYGIRVNAILPGGVETAMSSRSDFASRDLDALFGRMAVPRIGRPREIADAALFLTSEESSYVTGTTLVVDGGQTLGPVRPERSTPISTNANG
ncbi:SDR family NAD(P)-dependent oxidoreductase [Arthrobacter sp. NPDC058127]|uniref:SDR family NAD(P)-dependent oxidoreductase n=1 Tax=Arthrobacter sp. NPDC058127 TaxID=3346351 RepID=UPI0036E07163